MPTDEQPPRKPPLSPNMDGLAKALTPGLNAVSQAAAENLAKSIKPSVDALSKATARNIMKAAMPNLTALTKLGMGHTTLMREALPAPTLSDDYFRWEAERRAAPVVTRDAVLALGDSVQSLIVADENSSAALIGLTVWIIRLTVVLVVIGALSLGLTAYLIVAS